MKKQIYICDRCGNEYKEPTDWGDKNPDKVMCFHKQNGDEGLVLNVPSQYDLCHDCEKELLEWFYRKPIIEDGDGEDENNPGGDNGDNTGDNPEIPGGDETPDNPDENENGDNEYIGENIG